MYAEINEELEKKFKVTEFPLNIGLEPTNHCNLNCIMCDNDKLKRPRGYMSMALYKKIIDEIAMESPGSRVWLDFYGEAMLLGWRLYYMIDYAKKKGCKNVCINTNGTLMRPEFSDMLLDSGIDYISLDCDGYSKEVYEKIRINGNRDVFYKNAEYLLEEKRKRNSNCFVEIKIIEMEENAHEVDRIASYWFERGAVVSVRRRIDWLVEKKDKEDDFKDRIACGKAIGIMDLSWDGIIMGCHAEADGKFNFGRIEEKYGGVTIKSAWKKRNEEFIKHHVNHEWESLPQFCRQCSGWRIIGEDRRSPEGDVIDRSYEAKEKIYDKH